MARMNARAVATPIHTHEGGPAALHIGAVAQLRRLVMSCMLWEGEFYVDGQTIAGQIEAAAAKVTNEQLAQIAVEARTVAHLRHVPLLLLDLLTQRAKDVAGVVATVLERADEPGELIALNFARRGLLNVNKAKTLPHSISKGIELALQTKFNEYHLAKYDRDSKVKLKDVIRLVRPKPLNAEQAALWKRALKGELLIPDTWETALSAGSDKKETFERMLREKTIGYLALLRNLRGMLAAGVDDTLIKEAILLRKGSARVLPFRYVAAARVAPQLEREIDQALVACVGESASLEGRTLVLVDVSGSMDYSLSAKSDLTRLDAAAALACVINGGVQMFTFSNRIVSVPPRRGMAGADAIRSSQPHGGTDLGGAIAALNQHLKAEDRLIVITDEQTSTRVPTPLAGKNYLINVASARNGVGYGPSWTHIDGFSENVIRFIKEHEAHADV